MCVGFGLPFAFTSAEGGGGLSVSLRGRAYEKAILRPFDDFDPDRAGA